MKKAINWILLATVIVSFVTLVFTGGTQTGTGDELRSASPWVHVATMGVGVSILMLAMGIFVFLGLLVDGKLYIKRRFTSTSERIARNLTGLISGMVTTGVLLLLIVWMFQHSWTGQAEYSQSVLLAGTIFLSILSVAAGWIVGTDQSPVGLDWGLTKLRSRPWCLRFRLYRRWYAEEEVRAD